MDGAYGSDPVQVTGADELSFVDTTFNGPVCYQVRAVNVNGSSNSNGFEACAEVGVSEDFCAGVIRVSDAPGDQLGTTPLDINRLILSEPFIGDAQVCNATSEQKLVLELQVGNGVQVDGNSWIIIWNRQFPQDDGAGQIYDRNMVNLRIVGTSPVCSFGKITAPSVNQGIDVATLDSGDCQLEDGLITIQLPVDMIDDCENCPIGPGYELAGLEVRTFEVNQSGMVVAQTASNDFAVGLGYRLSGNDQCAPPAADGLEAIDDHAVISDDYPTIDIAVTENDAFDRCESVNIVEVTDGAHGLVNVNPDGISVSYDPVSVFCEDYFTYTLQAADGSTSQAVVVVESQRSVCQ